MRVGFSFGQGRVCIRAGYEFDEESHTDQGIKIVLVLSM